MKLTDHFTLEELTFSDTAQRLGIDNTPSEDIKKELARTASLLEAVRKILGFPLHINSGYRSKALNIKIGGAANSAHMYGRAADFVCPQFGNPLSIAHELSDTNLGFDKLIMEGTWIHISVPEAGVQPRGIILTATFKGGKATYSQGLK